MIQREPMKGDKIEKMENFEQWIAGKEEPKWIRAGVVTEVKEHICYFYDCYTASADLFIWFFVATGRNSAFRIVEESTENVND